MSGPGSEADRQLARQRAAERYRRREQEELEAEAKARAEREERAAEAASGRQGPTRSSSAVLAPQNYASAQGFRGSFRHYQADPKGTWAFGRYIRQPGALSAAVNNPLATPSSATPATGPRTARRSRPSTAGSRPRTAGPSASAAASLDPAIRKMLADLRFVSKYHREFARRKITMNKLKTLPAEAVWSIIPSARDRVLIATYIRNLVNSESQAAEAAGAAGDESKQLDFEAAAEEPKAEEPAAEEPKAEEPKAEEPKTEEPKAEEPKAEEPAAEEPAAEESKAEEAAEAAAEEPKAEEPAAEEPAAEEPKTEEPKAEEPKAEEPKAEEPKAEAPATEEKEETVVPAPRVHACPADAIGRRCGYNPLTGVCNFCGARDPSLFDAPLRTSLSGKNLRRSGSARRSRKSLKKKPSQLRVDDSRRQLVEKEEQMQRERAWGRPGSSRGRSKEELLQKYSAERGWRSSPTHRSLSSHDVAYYARGQRRRYLREKPRNKRQTDSDYDRVSRFNYQASLRDHDYSRNHRDSFDSLGRREYYFEASDPSERLDFETRNPLLDGQNVESYMLDLQQGREREYDDGSRFHSREWRTRGQVTRNGYSPDRVGGGFARPLTTVLPPPPGGHASSHSLLRDQGAIEYLP